MGIKKFCKVHNATILTWTGVVGVTATAVLAARATPKALALLEEQEEIKQANHGESLTGFEKFLVVAPTYAPTALMVLATSACILGADKLNKNKQKMLLSAYVTVSSALTTYQDKVKEVFGEEGHDKVLKELREDYDWMLEYGEFHEINKFYDPYSDRYFEMSIYDFQQAEYKTNRMYNFLGRLTLNEFYDFFGLEGIEGGDNKGWSAFRDWECIGYSWIEVNYEKGVTEDGVECFIIGFNMEPTADFEMYQ